ncbi:MAG TPA: hypothetical protein VGM90_19065 [Kofleriaceae bacterium]|jgi:hypothetical protein
MRNFFLVPLMTGVAIAGTIWGAKMSYRALLNRAPTQLSCADFLANRDGPDWVSLEQCEPADEGIGTESEELDELGESGAHKRRTTAVYIPLRAKGTNGGKTKAVLLAERQPFLSVANAEAPEAELVAFEAEMKRPLVGLVERRLDRSETNRDMIRGLGLHLADDFVVVDLDATPRPLWFAFGVLAAGLAGASWLVRWWRRREPPKTIPRAVLRSG